MSNFHLEACKSGQFAGGGSDCGIMQHCKSSGAGYFGTVSISSGKLHTPCTSLHQVVDLSAWKKQDQDMHEAFAETSYAAAEADLVLAYYFYEPIMYQKDSTRF